MQSRGCVLVFLTLCACGGATSDPAQPDPQETPKIIDVTRVDDSDRSFARDLPIVERGSLEDSLSVDTDLGPRTDANGNALRDGFQPLGRAVTTVQALDELYLGGYTFLGHASNIADDVRAGASIEFDRGDESWTRVRDKTATAFDRDGDGRQEIASVYFDPATSELALIISGPGTPWTRQLIEGGLSAVSGVYTSGIGWPIALARTDLELDGKDELLIGFGTHLYLWANGNITTPLTFPETHSVYVAAGSVDADPHPELVVTWTEGQDMVGRYRVLNSDFTVRTEGMLDHQYVDWFRYAAETWVKMGDIDGDGLDEVVFSGRRRTSAQWDVFVMDDANASFTFWESPVYLGDFYFDLGGLPDIIYRPSKLALLNLDLDGKKDIAVWDRVLSVQNGQLTQIANLEGFTSEATAGDFNNDGRDDLAYVSLGGALHVFTYEAQNGLTQMASASGTDVDESSSFPSVAITFANVDHDSRTVRYDDVHELRFADPTVIAAVAAPPCRAGVQNADSCVTTYGRSETTGMGNSQSVGMSVGVSFGYEWSDPFDIVGASFEVSLEKSFDFTTSHETSVTTSYAFTSGPDDDMVVYAVVPFDVYSYTIIDSPNAEEIGHHITINLPRTPQTRSASKSYFNANNGILRDVGRETFVHTAGDVSTYMSPVDRAQLEAKVERGKLFKSTLLHPSLNAGATVAGIDASDVETNERGEAMSVNVSVGAKAGGFTTTLSAGFSSGYSYSLSFEKTVSVSGSVGEIHDLSEDYGFGMLLYPQDSMLVVNYWVE